ncbi:MAG: hypothetical protein H0X11_04145 [Betaproteobacteria bacterium]|nr:hypothetical protein [Betaproteobacteria bacterium]
MIDAAEVSERISISGTLFDDIDERSKLVAAMADRGMPWQMSVGIHPGRMDEIKVGAKAEVNGQSMAGPLTVFRNNRVREVSFCTLGADSLTSAQVFTIGATQDVAAATPEPPKMSEISKEDYDRAITDLATTKASLEASNAKIVELEGKFAAQALEHRTSAVKELFAAINRDYKDTDAAPYLSMDDVVFAAVSKDLRAARPALDPSLMKTHADGGVDDAAKPKTAAQITDAARQHIAAQAKLGFTITNAEAVQFVARAA